MKKKISAGILLILVLVLTMSAAASASVSKEAALEAAKKVIPASCKLKKAELDKEDREWEFEFLSRNKKTKYEVTVHTETGAVKEAEMERRYDNGGRSVKISSKKAKKAVKKLFGKIRITSAKKRKDDGKYVFKIRFTAKGYKGKAEVNAATGKVIEWTKYYR